MESISLNLLPKVFRTEGDVVEFEPQKIMDSLIKETGLAEEVARSITELAVRRIISAGMKFLSGPHIREIVCSVLSEQHYEAERKLYTRIGMPLMDYEEILETPSKQTNPEKIHHWAANQLSEEYTLLRILNDEESKAHLYGDIHIHKLRYFDLRPMDQTWDPRLILKHGLPPGEGWSHCSKSGPAGTLEVAVSHLAKWLGMTQGEFSSEQGYEHVSTFLAPYARNMDYDAIKQAIQSLIFEINQLSAVIGRSIPGTFLTCSPNIPEEFLQVPVINPHAEADETYGSYQREAELVFKAMAEIYLQGDYLNNPFEFPDHLIYVREDWLQEKSELLEIILQETERMNSARLINLGARWQASKISELVHDGELFNHGTLQSICVNLPRLTYLSTDEDEFFEHITEKFELCAGILLKKYQTIEKRLESNHLPICSSLLEGKAIFSMEKQKLAIDFVGLNEAVKQIIGNEIHENNESVALAEKIIANMVQKCSELTKTHHKHFVLQENRSKQIPIRFTRLDLKHFPEMAKMGPDKDEMSYINSALLNQKAELKLEDRIKIRSRFHELIKNQVKETIPLSELQQSAISLKEFIMQTCKNSDLGTLIFHS